MDRCPTPLTSSRFVVDVEPAAPTRVGEVDLYIPDTQHSPPLIILVHGGPMRTPPSAPPSRWPVYIGYSSLLRSQGAAVAVFNHALLAGDRQTAADQLESAIKAARDAEGIDAAHVVLWFFSGGGRLSPRYLKTPPNWLRGIAYSYAVLDEDDPVWSPRAALHPGLSVPLLVTRVGQENPGLVDGQQRFLDKAAQSGVPLSIIDVPHGKHAFDAADAIAESQHAVTEAIQWVVGSSTTN